MHPLSIAFLGAPIPKHDADFIPNFPLSALLNIDIVAYTPQPLPTALIDAAVSSIHWQKELTTFLVSRGKTLVVFLTPFEEEEWDDEPISNYDFFPILPPDFTPLQTPQTDIVPLQSNISHFLTTHFAPYLNYAITWKSLPIPLWTNAKNECIGGYIPAGKGHIILAPAIQWQHPQLWDEDADEWTPQALDLADKTMAFLQEIHLKFTSPKK